MNRLSVLLTAASGTDLDMPVALALLAGLRAGEVCALRWLDIDLQAGTLTVGSHEDGWSPKNRESCTLPMCPDLVACLAEAHACNGQEALVCSKGGKPWLGYDLSRKAARLIRSLGIEATLHNLRHTYVTALVADAENDPKTVQRLARHKNISTTFDIYAHAEAPRLRQAVGRLSLGRHGAPAHSLSGQL